MFYINNKNKILLSNWYLIRKKLYLKNPSLNLGTFIKYQKVLSCFCFTYLPLLPFLVVLIIP